MFNRRKTIHIAAFSGLIATIIGLVTFTLSWHFFEFWGGPIPGYSILLYPGNISLIYLWHPLLTEEINLLPKLSLILLGQFTVVTTSVAIAVTSFRKFKNINE